MKILSSGIILFVFAIITLTVQSQYPEQEKAANRILHIDIKGYISPATAQYVEESFSEANSYSAVIITLDTLGGLGDSMFSIIERMENSPVPVIGYVYPPGSEAESAGTYILMASDFAAMSPHTVIGSAQPVVGTQPTTEPKLINFLKEKMSSYARRHGRNETQAVRFITHNDNLSPEAALRLNVIEAVVDSIEELLKIGDGRIIETLKGPKTLSTSSPIVVKAEPGIRNVVLSYISEPLVSSLLLSLGTLILVLGFTSPGWGAEIAGAIMIVLGLLGQGFNVNLSALLLLLIGAGLILYEVYSHSFGIAGIGGLATLALGIVLLVTFPTGPLLVSPGWLSLFFATLAIVMTPLAGFLGFLILKAAMALRRRGYFQPYPKGIGRSVDEIEPGKHGYVVVEGEYWRATSREKIGPGTRVKVLDYKNGLLVVRALEDATN